jgi:hydroxymethylbilane synthase
VKLLLGTRGSELALTQARMAQAALREKCNIEVQIEVIRTSGDQARSVIPRDAEGSRVAAFKLSSTGSPGFARDEGRKGLFTAELERALLDRRIDLAVHSAKDLPSETATGLTIAAVLPRAAVEDLLVTKTPGLSTLGTVATGSVRRQHQLRFFKSVTRIVDLRGNVPTRLRKFASSSWDAIVLARAGLERLGFRPPQFECEGQRFFAEVLPLEMFVPAGGQGIIALQSRTEDASRISAADENAVHLCLRAEREFLRLLEGDCETPVGAHARWVSGEMELRVQLFAGEPEPAMSVVSGTDPSALARRAFEKIRAGARA